MTELVSIRTVEMHTAGEPVRIITDGYPIPEGATLLERRRDAQARLDRYRRLLMSEPRGHAEMYGALLVPPDLPDAHMAVLFLHNEGYSTMCGHAVVALGRYAVDHGLVAGRSRSPRSVSSALAASSALRSRRGRPAAGAVRERALLRLCPRRRRGHPHFGPVTLDIGYGGAFYAVLPAAELGLDLEASPLARLVDAAMEIKEAASRSLALAHPRFRDLAFLYGTILTDGADDWTRSPRPTSASSPTARSTAAPQAPVSARGWRSCTAAAGSGSARAAASAA